MNNREAIDKIKWRIKTASHIAGKGEDGKAFEDLDIAIQAIEELEQYRELGTVEQVREAVRFYDMYGEAYYDVMEEMSR